ncbi:hypothetical protein C8J56DRAFT_1057610 [Mycena floridula]|nr:hypothetical protein C8J56DRAFT_1057610 [Mycena floridula]
MSKATATSKAAKSVSLPSAPSSSNAGVKAGALSKAKPGITDASQLENAVPMAADFSPRAKQSKVVKTKDDVTAKPSKGLRTLSKPAPTPSIAPAPIASNVAPAPVVPTVAPSKRVTKWTALTTPVLASDEVLSNTVTDTSPGGRRHCGFSYQRIRKVISTPAKEELTQKRSSQAASSSTKSSDEEISHSATSPDVIGDFQDLVNTVYGAEPLGESLGPEFPPSPSPPPIPSSSKAPPPAPHRRQPLKSAMKPAPPPSPPGAVEETPFREILVLYEGGTIPDIFLSEWERR